MTLIAGVHVYMCVVYELWLWVLKWEEPVSFYSRVWDWTLTDKIWKPCWSPDASISLLAFLPPELYCKPKWTSFLLRIFPYSCKQPHMTVNLNCQVYQTESDPGDLSGCFYERASREIHPEHSPHTMPEILKTRKRAEHQHLPLPPVNRHNVAVISCSCHHACLSWWGCTPLKLWATTGCPLL